MVYKGLCRIETLAFRVAYSWSALDILLLWSSKLDFVLYSRCIRLVIKRLQRSSHYRASILFLVLYPEPFFMAHKDLCQIKTLAFRVALTGSVHESLSFFNKSQGRFIRSRFLVLHSGPFYLAYKDLCLIESLTFRVCSLIRAGVRQLVLHREPFFFLTRGLRFLYSLKISGYDAYLTIHPKIVRM